MHKAYSMPHCTLGPILLRDAHPVSFPDFLHNIAINRSIEGNSMIGMGNPEVLTGRLIAEVIISRILIIAL